MAATFPPASARLVRLGRRLAGPWAEPQHRNAVYLMLNTVTGGLAGLLFWVIFSRLAGLPVEEIGVGYAIVALGTMIAVLAKGGLDTALLRMVPGASRPEGLSLLRFAVGMGCALALLVTATLALVASFGGAFLQVTAVGWALVAAVAVLLVITWLQDAYFLAEGDARFSFRRNLVLSGVRVALPLPLVALAWPRPVAIAWGLALAVSAAAAVGFARRLAERPGRRVPRREFLASAARNLSGSAAEFFPGLLLAPLVLALNGPAAAAYFGMAWAAASLLFLACAAISRSALAQMVRDGPASHAAALRRAILQLGALVLPAAFAGVVLGSEVLGVFGPGYGTNGGPMLALLALSVVFVAPAYLYLAVLRARDRPLVLILFPTAMVLALLTLASVWAVELGPTGVAAAWLVANVPFGLYGAWRLRRELREVMPSEPAALVGRRAHLE